MHRSHNQSGITVNAPFSHSHLGTTHDATTPRHIARSMDATQSTDGSGGQNPRAAFLNHVGTHSRLNSKLLALNWQASKATQPVADVERLPWPPRTLTLTANQALELLMMNRDT